ncbi:MAG: primosomal protein N' [Gemmatimonadota bacterium]|nr:MAG: primosomal protein N' [Gemmatimonadota bacterium]
MDKSSNGGRMANSALCCRVAVPRPVYQTFTYALAEEIRDRAAPGMRVRVPFGRGETIGCIDAVAVDPPPGGARMVSELIDKAPVLSPRLLEICRWTAQYYVAPLGLVFRAALPPGLLADASEDAADAGPVRQVLRLVRHLPTLEEREALFGRAYRQREALEALEELGGASTIVDLEAQGFSRAVLGGLVERGVAMVTEERLQRDPFAGMDALPEPSLRPTRDQVRAIDLLDALLERPDPGVALLRGVTGSGKTLVYIRIIESALASGRGAILLVPEISLTPQTVQRFRSAFGDAVAVLHSGLSGGERRDAWQALRDGRKRIAIGARSAVFAPVDPLGVVILDEEHEGSYKQSETPRYHARAVAAVRCRREGALCLLGSATPSLESWENAHSGRYTLVELPQRVTSHPLPAVHLVDLRAPRDREASGPTSGGPALSPPLRQAVERCLERSEQCILLLNRRGFATFVQCEHCGKVWSCKHCNVSLTFHRRRRALICHHCGFSEPPPVQCDECEVRIAYSGIGTEQVEQRLGEVFPAARIARMDLDTTTTKWSHFRILERMRRREVDILLGTQMIAKGLDFPAVTLVGVINADVGLSLPDFRASERTFQLLSQVAGRAGRGTEPGEVIVQTARPSHFALLAAVDHDYAGFASRELEDRREPGYPPHRRLANVVVSGRSETRVTDLSAELADWTRGLISSRSLDGVETLGPAPCPIDRLRGRWRWHFLLKSNDPRPLGSVLRFLAVHRGQPSGDLRIEIDRDPESLL